MVRIAVRDHGILITCARMSIRILAVAVRYGNKCKTPLLRAYFRLNTQLWRKARTQTGAGLVSVARR